MAHIWVRAEQREFEQRVGLTPAGARQLLAAGHSVTVEESDARAIPIADYADAGCRIAAADSWMQAPSDVIVFGLKELNEDGPDLAHRHIMFGHAYKGQADGPALLNRFKRGGGTLYDLEYLTDADGRRVAAFGYWAGFAGAAVGVKAWLAQQAGEKLGPVDVYPNKTKLVSGLINDLASVVAQGTERPSTIIIGALGRVGSGAVDLSEALGLVTTKWDMAETAHGGPFPEILDHSIFVNCILAGPGVPVFVPKDSIRARRRLRVIADVSCDPNSDYNPVPVYDRSTTFADPVVRVSGGPEFLDVMAIDNLPSMLPLESSEDYAGQLLPSLMQLDAIDEGVWGRAEGIFKHYIEQL